MRLTPSDAVRTYVRTMIVFMLAAGCGSSQPTPQQACEHFAQLCGDKDEVAECTRNLTGIQGEMNADAYGKMMSCTGGADTCGEWLGCTLGGLGAEADPETKRQIDGLVKGLRRMHGEDTDSRDTKPRSTNPRDTTPDRDAEPPLPPECARIDELCDPDETLVRDGCRKMVRNIRSDTASLGKLAACFAQAKNCYALDNCVDELWRELN